MLTLYVYHVSFATELEAAEAYNKGAKIEFGTFAKLNILE